MFKVKVYNLRTRNKSEMKVALLARKNSDKKMLRHFYFLDYIFFRTFPLLSILAFLEKKTLIYPTSQKSGK